MPYEIDRVILLNSRVFRLRKLIGNRRLRHRTQPFVSHITNITVRRGNLGPVLQLFQDCHQIAFSYWCQNRALDTALIADVLVAFDFRLLDRSPFVSHENTIRLLKRLISHICVLFHEICLDVRRLSFQSHNNLIKGFCLVGNRIFRSACRDLDYIRRRGIEHELIRGIPVKTAV